MHIAIISDNHSYIGDDIISNIQDVDEIWHAGDMGDLSSIDQLAAIKPLIGVYGNVDDHNTRAIYPLNQIFEREGIKVLMTHIGGYPPRYTDRVKNLLIKEKPYLYICGHSHICKVVKDTDLNIIHMNPGAYGHHGFHKFRTFIKMQITAGKIHDLKVVELGYRGRPI